MGARRRTSYGPTSPDIGARGAQTRRRITEAALESFATRGYHATVMEDLASALDVSRATLYQYFAGKGDIFVELVEASGSALQQAARELGPLGPSQEGFANLCAWLDAWGRVFDRYEALFIEWANVNSPSMPLRPRMSRFVTAHTRKLASEFDRAGCAVDSSIASVVITGVVDRYHYLRAAHSLAIDDAVFRADLALACQRFLFPATPIDVLGGVGRHHDPSERRPPPPAPAAPDRFDDLSPQARTTADRLLDAASLVFAEFGHTGATVDQIVTAAGVARGTAYKYYNGVADLFGALAEECGHRMGVVAADLGDLDASDSRALRAWLVTFLQLHHRYAGVLRAWSTTSTGDPRVDHARDAVLAQTFAGFDRLTGGAHRPRPRRETGRLMFIAMLERTPDVALGTAFAPTDEELVEVQAQFVERGLLGLEAPPAESGSPG